jgi:hypothetical protein
MEVYKFNDNSVICFEPKEYPKINIIEYIPDGDGLKHIIYKGIFKIKDNKVDVEYKISYTSFIPNSKLDDYKINELEHYQKIKLKNYVNMENTVKENNIISVDMFPTGRAQWRTLGTEYTKSFTALKEITDNSISASGDRDCKIIIKILSLTNQYRISIEDNSGGVEDVQRLITIATESEKKEGNYNIYGLGLKNCLAYFNDDYDNSDWLIQTRNEEDFKNGNFIQIKSPYCYPGEYNEKHEHYGMNITKKTTYDEPFKGVFDTPGTYIEFITPHEVFNNMNPLKTGAPNKLLPKIAKELSDLFSVFYLDLLKKQKVKIDILYSENNTNKKWEKLSCETHDLPIARSLKNVKEVKKSNFGGKMKIDAHWFEINREMNDSPFIYAQKRGFLLYVNGILVEPYKWVDKFFGGHAEHPSYNNMCLYVSVWGDKKDLPELSVSKTKIKENGENTKLLYDFLEEECPNAKITESGRLGKSKSEFERRDKRYEGQLTEWQNRGFIKNLSKEKIIKIGGGKSKDSLKVDIFYEEMNGKIIIEEFKKEVFQGASSFGQIIVYYDLLKNENPDKTIEIKLVAGFANNSTHSLIDFYNEHWKSLGRKDSIKFESYTELMIP